MVGNREDRASVPTICPKCLLGDLTKHCPPENRCGWWCCEFECGYAVGLYTGVATNYLSRRQRGVDSGRGTDDNE